MKLIGCICLLGVTLTVQAYADQLKTLIEDWENFKLDYNRQYANKAEERMRRKFFREYRDIIAKHNVKFEKGLTSYRMKMNRFGDRDFDEISKNFMGFSNSASEKAPVYNYSIDDTLPDSIDWRTKGAVTPVKDQKDCSSGWAFSATGALEAQLWKKSDMLIPLSEQNLIDCAWMKHNCGCRKGKPTSAFKYVAANEGINSESSYPYQTGTFNCRYQKDKNAGYNLGYVEIPEGNEYALKSAVAKIGPISVGINAFGFGMIFYSDGILNSPVCKSTLSDLTHAMLVVGYGKEEGFNGAGFEYWIVKNSWGSGWGEEGYIKIARNLHNQCGIATRASYPIV